ncbi:hypothetical protein WI73_02435 [Burkholderia ubonensis]|nr:hypothetical protein WI73_02435 [Burkholderia ubonensis]
MDEIEILTIHSSSWRDTWAKERFAMQLRSYGANFLPLVETGLIWGTRSAERSPGSVQVH